ncbi:GNAT family N-acetyltransferase [Candidatus Harpocratesius sp.]
MHLIVRAGTELIPEIVEILNSNAPLYRNIIHDASCSDEIDVDQAWAEKNFQFREFFILRDNGAYQAFATYQKMEFFSYIGYFFVRYDQHRKNYGQSLMSFLEFQTMRDSLSEIRLFVHKQAKWALKFYKKQGFTVISCNKNEIITMDKGIMEPFYVDEHIYMHKQLSIK